ncbi:MAG: NAD(P)H-dependent oxidoreductase [Rhodocyclaceae bacterium]|nr:NAD(P)H-dependent oxidoreductase [Rhodocyclaceae bacterium]MBX3668428.1 NAD(P)H-dependent oxidoreductase [Rhodocyclaceae bacterium]
MAIRIVVFAGSTRTDSLNKKLARQAARAVDEAGGESAYFDLRDYPMPLYDGDLEAREGIPPNALAIRNYLQNAKGLIIASPENNSSMSAVLKNTLDWVSRPWHGKPGDLPYRGRVAALIAASPGALGGLRGLGHLRATLQGLGVLVLSEQMALPRADQAFDGDGRLVDAKQQAKLQEIATRLVDVAKRLG